MNTSHRLTNPSIKKKQITFLHHSISGSYFDRAEVHWVFDDVVVIVQLQRFGVDGLVERPGVGRVLLGQHLLQDDAAKPEPLAQAALPLLWIWRLLLLLKGLPGLTVDPARFSQRPLAL